MNWKTESLYEPTLGTAGDQWIPAEVVVAHLGSPQPVLDEVLPERFEPKHLSFLLL